MTGLQKRLLAWYAKYGRANLPWRVVRNPYYTVVSEFMLQQTQVDRVVPIFGTFISRFPTFAALAKGPRSEVVRYWKGLGYNTRAVRLKALADAVVAKFDGEMPSDEKALLELPGVGPYTVAAIRAFAFNYDAAANDTNVRRIVHRVHFGIEYPIKASTKELERIARELVPKGEAHDWNSAMMDLGALVCTARAPRCAACPLQTLCAAAPIDAARLERLREEYAKPPSAKDPVPFESTARFARGRIVDRLRELPPGERISLLDLEREIIGIVPPNIGERFDEFVAALEKDGVVARDGDGISLA